MLYWVILDLLDKLCTFQAFCFQWAILYRFYFTMQQDVKYILLNTLQNNISLSPAAVCLPCCYMDSMFSLSCIPSSLQRQATAALQSLIYEWRMLHPLICWILGHGSRDFLLQLVTIHYSPLSEPLLGFFLYNVFIQHKKPNIFSQSTWRLRSTQSAKTHLHLITCWVFPTVDQMHLSSYSIVLAGVVLLR